MVKFSLFFAEKTRSQKMADSDASDGSDNEQPNDIAAEAEEKIPQTWEDLGVCDALVKCVTRLGWKTPTEIQKMSLPYALT
jgi:superfamily II DNA/RNA helicase